MVIELITVLTKEAKELARWRGWAWALSSGPPGGLATSPFSGCGD